MKKRVLSRVAILSVIFSLAVSISPLSAFAKTNQQKMANAYYGILNNIVSKYGVSTSTDDDGLVYANIVDFDKDGISELYLLYIKNDKSRGDSLRFYQEIWNYKKSKIHKIYSDDQGADGLVSDRSISITTTKKDTYLIFTGSYSTGNGELPYSNEWSIYSSIMTVRGGKLIEIASLRYIQASTPEDDNDIKITRAIEKNGKTKSISEKEYEELGSIYGFQNNTTLVEGNAGSPVIASDLNLNVVNDFIKKIKKMM
jgi:hypothetical protein